MPAPDPSVPTLVQTATERQGLIEHLYAEDGSELSVMAFDDAHYVIIRADDGSWVGGPAAGFTLVEQEA